MIVNKHPGSLGRPPTTSRTGAPRIVAADLVDNIVSLSKRRGFVFPSGEIYGGTRSAWDYGPLGVELKDNVKRHWWKSMVQGRDDVVGLDSSVILPTKVWEASGHIEQFVAPVVEFQSCHRRFRPAPRNQTCWTNRSMFFPISRELQNDTRFDSASSSSASPIAAFRLFRRRAE